MFESFNLLITWVHYNLFKQLPQNESLGCFNIPLVIVYLLEWTFIEYILQFMNVSGGKKTQDYNFLHEEEAFFVHTCKFLSKNCLFSQPWLTLYLHYLFNVTNLFQWKWWEMIHQRCICFSLLQVNLWITTFLKILH